MRFVSIRNCGLFSVLLFLASPLFAHHVRFRPDEPKNAIVLQGTVVEVSIANPHVFLALEAKNTVGNPAIHQIDLGSVANMLRHGIKPDTFVAGDRIAVTVWRKRNNNFWYYQAQGFLAEDGTQYGLAPPAATDLAAQ